VLEALLENETVRGAARAAGVSPGAVYRLLKNSAFSAALEAGRKEVFSDALRRLKGSANAAIDRLVGIVEGQDPEEARKAAGTLLAMSLKAHELIEVEGKIAELEGLVAAAAPPPKTGAGG
jgi:AcrR family transcriptional regulator